MREQTLTPQQALPKIKHYCAYQERCHQDVKEKLYSYGLHKNDVEEMISKMIQENFLNEERFAVSFARGKFRINQWGRVKIKYELKQKQVSDYCIKTAIEGIVLKDYLKTLHKLGAIKLKSLESEKNKFVRKKKLQDYLRTKGYEGYLINELINELIK